jgi:GTP-binding protein EngB required for normal cell division
MHDGRIIPYFCHLKVYAIELHMILTKLDKLDKSS